MNSAEICQRCIAFKPPFVCPVDHVSISVHALAADCPLGKHAGISPPAANPAPAPASPSPTALLWLELHRRPHFPDLDLSVERAWIGAWLARLPSCGGCRAEAERHIAEEPPDLTGPQNYSRWSCRFHNRINRKLGKREWTEGEVWVAYMLHAD